VLAVCAASLALLISQVVDDRTLEAADAFRIEVVRAMAAAAAATALACGAYVAIKGLPALEQLERLARLTAPLSVLGLFPPVLTRSTTDALQTALTIAVLTVLFERLLRMSLAEWHRRERGFVAPASLLVPKSHRWVAALLVVGCAGFYAYYMSKYTVYNHRRFGTYGYDLGQYDNIFWTTLHGYPLRCTPLGLIKNWHEIGNHADMSVFFLLPFYAIRPRAETLLIMQSAILGLGAIPVYLFAARRLPPAYAAALAVCYLLYAPLHGANFYDFHFQPVASTFVLFTIYFIDGKRWIPAAIAFVIALGCREDISVGLTMFGLYCLYTGYRPRAGVAMAAVGASYFVAMRFFIMPRFGSSWFSDIYRDLYPQPDGEHSFGGVIQTLSTNPTYVFRTLLTSDKLRYFLQIMTPIAFLPMRRGWLLPALAPGTLFTLVTTAYPPTTDIAFQYSGHFTPYVFMASAVMLASYRSDSWGRPKTTAALAAVVVGTLLCALQWGAFPPRGIRGGFSFVNFSEPTASDAQKERDLAELLTMIPEESTYAVSEQELPHVSDRLTVRSLKYDTNGADYLLYGTNSIGADVAARALGKGEYTEVARRPGLALLKRKP
jgi:uncharacterized membrane protein